MSLEEFLKLPDDGVHRSLIRGVVREDGTPVRNQAHAHAVTRVAKFLDNWRDEQTPPNGLVLAGQPMFQLAEDTLVGIDIGVISSALASAQVQKAPFILGIPRLVVKVLCPNDTMKKIHDTIDICLAVEVPLVWIVNTRQQTVTIYRPDHLPTMVNADQELTAEPVLPGFRVPVADLFR